jgi:hypothetical protein
VSASRMLSHDVVVHANIEMDLTQTDPKGDDLVNSLILESQGSIFHGRSHLPILSIGNFINKRCDLPIGRTPLIQGESQKGAGSPLSTVMMVDA